MSQVDPEKEYLDMLSRHAVLSKDEQLEHIRRWQEEGDEESRRIMVEANVRLVMREAKRKCRDVTSPVFMDLLQEGVLGVMDTLDKFDRTTGYSFSTYAVWWIRSRISLAWTDNNRSLKILKHMHTDVNRATRELKSKLKREPSDNEIYDHLGWSPEAQRRYERVRDSRLVSIHNVKPEDLHLNSSHVSEIEEQADNGLTELLASEMRGDLLAGLQLLDRTTREIIQRINCIGYTEASTYSELSRDLKISRDKMRTLEHEGLRRMWLFVEDGRLSD